VNGRGESLRCDRRSPALSAADLGKPSLQGCKGGKKSAADGEIKAYRGIPSRVSFQLIQGRLSQGRRIRKREGRLDYGAKGCHFRKRREGEASVYCKKKGKSVMPCTRPEVWPYSARPEKGESLSGEYRGRRVALRQGEGMGGNLNLETGR